CRSELLHGSQDFDIYPPQLITLTYSSKKSGERDEMAENFCSAAYLFFETLQFMVHKKLWSLQPILSSLQKEATSK
ncbi:MAG: hypothetical protein K0Q74_793, partial [Gammaproteobacteria bacterium]|nr:hypothetical protein [Gammaproteobacteria bacterium]